MGQKINSQKWLWILGGAFVLIIIIVITSGGGALKWCQVYFSI